MDTILGQVVCSKAGRDNGKKFVIIDVIDEAYVLISDGDLRRTEKPKKKKIKHLKFTGTSIPYLAVKLENGQKATNPEVRKALEALKEEFGDNGRDLL